MWRWIVVALTWWLLFKITTQGEQQHEVEFCRLSLIFGLLSLAVGLVFWYFDC